jgi:hypothetical protein
VEETESSIDRALARTFAKNRRNAIDAGSDHSTCLPLDREPGPKTVHLGSDKLLNSAW